MGTLQTTIYNNNDEITMIEFECVNASDPSQKIITKLPHIVLNNVTKSYLEMSYYDDCLSDGYTPNLTEPTYPLSSHIEIAGWDSLNFHYPPLIDPETGKYRADKFIIVDYSYDGDVTKYNDLIKESVTEYGYDQNSNLTSTTIDGEILFTKKFDNRGNEIYFSDNKGSWYIKEYDRFNNVSYENYSTGFEAWYVYNSENKLIYYKNSQGDEMYYYYDKDGNLIKQSPTELDLGTATDTGCIDAC